MEMEKRVEKHIEKEKWTREKGGKKKDMRKIEETEINKVILMTVIETKTRGNEDKRKVKMKNKRMLDGN
jgi:hypothetical protein